MTSHGFPLYFTAYSEIASTRRVKRDAGSEAGMRDVAR
jgi:hypothetical protein